MNNLNELSLAQLKKAVVLKERIATLERELAAVLGSPATLGNAPKKGKMSAAGKAKIAAAQKARWAKIKAAKSAPATKRAKRTMSAASKAALSAKLKAVWAARKAAKKK